jgi:hypothetical protein
MPFQSCCLGGFDGSVAPKSVRCRFSYSGILKKSFHLRAYIPRPEVFIQSRSSNMQASVERSRKDILITAHQLHYEGQLDVRPN